MSINIKFSDATQHAFEHWDDSDFPHAVRKLRAKYFNAGSETNWKRFRYAVACYKDARENGRTEDEAISNAKQSYPDIVLKKMRKWVPTKNLTSSRVGIHPKDMKQKPGRKKKASAGTYLALGKAIHNHPKATDADLAEILNARPSQATDNECTQPNSPARKITIKGTKKFDSKDVQKMRTEGAKANRKNEAGNFRGMGRVNYTVQSGRKMADEWEPDHGRAFLEERAKYHPAEIGHFDATHHSSRVVDKGKVKGKQGSSRVHKTNERVATGATGYALTWAGSASHDPGLYEAFEPNFPKCDELKKAKRGCDFWPCSHGPATGVDRQCGGGGTRFQHCIHLRKGLRMFLKGTGIEKRKRRRKKLPAGRGNHPTRVLQLDKSTNLVYLRKQNELGYNGVPTKRLQTILDDLEKEYKVHMKVLIQPTHYFPFNANDALTFSLIKSNARKIAARPRNFPKNVGDLRENWNEACENVSDHALQASVKRSHSVDEYHNKNLGNPPYDPRLDDWGKTQLSQNVLSQPLDEMYDDYPMNGETDTEDDDSDQFWDEV